MIAIRMNLADIEQFPKMRDLIGNPLWRPEDLGKPIPDSPHAVSACLPTWRDTVGYEEDDPRVHESLTTGYPRFVYHRLCRDLFAACAARFARDGETCQVYPSRPAAERFCQFLETFTGSAGRIHVVELNDAHAVCFPQEHERLGRDAWQHFGEGISSRRAEACLHGETGENAPEAKTALQERIARLYGVTADEVFLYPSGMNAIYTVHRALNSVFPNRKSVQFGFPYVDSLKIQQKVGAGAHFYPRGTADDLQDLSRILEGERVCGLYTEFPSNPLLVCPDLERLADLARRHEFPLILDDTLATIVNAELLPTADVVCTSLTKFFSGVGDVTGGSAVLSPRSPFYAELADALRRETEDLVWGPDAVVLERNSRDLDERVRRINTGAEALADYLQEHPQVTTVNYPKFRTPEEYGAYLRPGGRYGGLMSITVEQPERNAPRLFDALRVCKGPNLGMNYTMACPYTILAHYRELDFAESCGVSRWLIRISVGLEEPDELIARFEEALDTVNK